LIVGSSELASFLLFFTSFVILLGDLDGGSVLSFGWAHETIILVFSGIVR
jgi:hypothetical protein